MRHTTHLLVLYCACLIPRLLFAVIAGKTQLTLDEIEYDRLAWSLTEGWGYVSFFGLESTFRPPGYPLFLALIYSISGPDYYVARIAQAFFTATIGPLTYLLGRHVVAERPARYAGYIAGLFPTLGLFSIGLMSENIFIPLLLLNLYLIILLIERPSKLIAVITGLALAYLILVRSELTLAVLLLLGGVVYAATDRKVALKHVAIVLTIIVIPVASWSYRNYSVTGQFIYLDSRTGLNLHIAFNETATGNHNSKNYGEIFEAYFEENRKRAAPNLTLSEARSAFLEEWFAYKERVIPDHPDIDRLKIIGEHWMHNYGKTLALEYVAENPLEVIKMMPKKFYYFWNLDHRMMTFGYSNNVIGYVPPVWLAVLFFVVLTPFAVVTLGALTFLTVSRWPRYTAVLLIPIAFMTAVHSVIFADARYHYPIIPLLAIFFCGLIWDSKVQIREARGVRLWVLTGLIVLAMSIWIIGLVEAYPRYKIIFAERGNETYMKL